VKYGFTQYAERIVNAIAKAIKKTSPKLKWMLQRFIIYIGQIG